MIMIVIKDKQINKIKRKTNERDLVELSGYVAYTYKKYKNDVFVWVNGKRFEVKNQIKLN
jgi:hypothetical protein